MSNQSDVKSMACREQPTFVSFNLWSFLNSINRHSNKEMFRILLGFFFLKLLHKADLRFCKERFSASEYLFLYSATLNYRIFLETTENLI